MSKEGKKRLKEGLKKVRELEERLAENGKCGKGVEE